MFRPSRNIDSHPRASNRTRAVDQPILEEKIDNSPSPSRHQRGNSGQARRDSDKPRAIDPVPIGARGMRIVREFPMAESNLLKEDAEYTDSIISLFSVARRHSAGEEDPEAYGDIAFVARKSQRRRSKKIRHRGSSASRSPQIQSRKVGDSGGDSARGTNSSDSSTATSSSAKSKGFRSYQTALWGERFEELQRYAKAHGNCLVPHNWKENLSLAKWVKRQRYQYKLKMERKHSTLTDERQAALEGLGFIWDSHSAVWEERLQELKEFKQRHGHCNVPSTYSENHSLSIWVQCQRRQYKLHRSGGGKRSHMSSDRIAKLDDLGFVWDPRNRDNEL